MAEKREWLPAAFQLCFLENEKNAERDGEEEDDDDEEEDEQHEDEGER